MISFQKCRHLCFTILAGTLLVGFSQPVFAQNELPGLTGTYNAQPKGLNPPLVPPAPKSALKIDQVFRQSPPPFQHGYYGDNPHLGQGDDPGQGYPHYDHPSHRYGQYYRPKAFGRGAAERCAPSPFRPRGYGNLFNESSMCHRIDYHRYALKDHASDFGPSYYRRQPDPRCADHDRTGKYRPGCNACGERKTKVWTLSGRSGK
jgi:hypothetical protein